MSNLLSQASLVMIPSGYKEDTVYCPVPTNGNGDLSFTRASNGTRTNSAGLVEEVPWNLAQQSETFDNAGWVKVRTTITANDTTAPNGTLTADKVSLNSGTNSKLVQQAYNQNGAFTQSVYAKAGTHNFMQLLVGSDATPYCNFDLVNGTYSASGCTASITSVGNGWFYLTMSYSTTIGTDYYLWAVDSLSSARADATSSTGYYYAWGFQLNIGSTAKPYFPTTDRLNVPRLTYQNGGGGCPSLLLEKQSTNYVKYSQDFTQIDWQQSGATITANAIISPDGTQNATRLQFSAGSRYLYQSLFNAGIPAGNVTISCYIKGASVQKIGFSDGNSNPNEITLTTDWQRYTFTFTYSSGGIGIQFDNYFGVTPSGQTKDFYLWGAQLEASSYATSYIPTTSSSATRVVDTFALKDITSFSIGNAYTILLDVTMQSSDNNKVFFETRTSTAATSLTARNFNGALRLYNNIDASYPLAAVSSSTNKWVVRLNGTSYDLFAVSGGIATKDSATITTARNFGYFELAGGTTQLYFDELVIFPTALTDAECQSLVL